MKATGWVTLVKMKLSANMIPTHTDELERCAFEMLKLEVKRAS